MVKVSPITLLEYIMRKDNLLDQILNSLIERDETLMTLCSFTRIFLDTHNPIEYDLPITVDTILIHTEIRHS